MRQCFRLIRRAGGEYVPGLELVYGHIVLINPTNGDKQIRLKLGEQTGVAKISRNHSLAVEVERKFVPGQDPRTTPAPVDVRLYAPDGGVVWTDAAGEKVAEKPSRWALTEAGAGEIAADPAPPEWIDREPIVQLSEQRYGAPVIDSTIVSNSPVDTQLLELFQGSSRKEVKSLVARSSIHVGLFQPFVDALRDSEQKANWKTHIDTLRTAMAMGPESANKVYQALVDQRGKPAAADLYEMLCSYTPDQVGRTAEEMKNGSVVKLINWLEDDSLDYRVLAAQDLWEITGKRLMPNPAASLAERKQNVRVWRSRLESGQLLKPGSAVKPEDESAREVMPSRDGWAIYSRAAEPSRLRHRVGQPFPLNTVIPHTTCQEYQYVTNEKCKTASVGTPYTTGGDGYGTG